MYGYILELFLRTIQQILYTYYIYINAVKNRRGVCEFF